MENRKFEAILKKGKVFLDYNQDVLVGIQVVLSEEYSPCLYSKEEIIRGTMKFAISRMSVIGGLFKVHCRYKFGLVDCTDVNCLFSILPLPNDGN